MSSNQFRSLLVCALCFTAAPTDAGLLAEIPWHDTLYDFGGIYPVPLVVETWNPGVATRAQILCPCEPANLGQVFTAEPGELEKMRAAFVSPVARIVVGGINVQVSEFGPIRPSRISWTNADSA
jgi:hypothetical protein